MSTSYSSLPDLVAAITATTKAIQTTEPEEIRALRTGELKIGTNYQYFTTWDFANSMLRDMSTSTWYPLLLTFEDEKFTLEQAIIQADRFDKQYSNYLRYSGFPKMWAFAVALIKHLPGAKDRKEAITAVRVFVAYLNRLAAWSFHFFPWGLGENFSYAPSPIGVSKADLTRRVTVQHGLKVKLTWQPLNITVIAFLAVNENEELVTDFVKILPFTVLQDHAVVSGESMYAWSPLVSTAPICVKERQCDAPIGRIRYSQGTGNKVIIQYGSVTEDIETPVLGEVLPEYASKLAYVGATVLKSTMKTKEIIMLTMDLIN